MDLFLFVLFIAVASILTYFAMKDENKPKKKEQPKRRKQARGW